MFDTAGLWWQMEGYSVRCVNGWILYIVVLLARGHDFICMLRYYLYVKSICFYHRTELLCLVYILAHMHAHMYSHRYGRESAVV